MCRALIGSSALHVCQSSFVSGDTGVPELWELGKVTHAFRRCLVGHRFAVGCAQAIVIKVMVPVGDEIVDLGGSFGATSKIHREHAARFTAAKGSVQQAMIENEDIARFAFERLGG